MRWGRIVLVGSKLPLVIVVFSAVVAAAIWRFSMALGSPQLDKAGSMILLAGFCSALVLWLWFFYRLRAWETGTADPCAACEGPLGGLHEGKVYYGRQLGDFRRCYNCGKCNSQTA